MVSETTSGKMAASMKVTIDLTRSTAKALILTQMEACTVANGSTECSMALDASLTLILLTRRKESGHSANLSSGLSPINRLQLASD